MLLRRNVHLVRVKLERVRDAILNHEGISKTVRHRREGVHVEPGSQAQRVS